MNDQLKDVREFKFRDIFDPNIEYVARRYASVPLPPFITDEEAEWDNMIGFPEEDS